MLVQCLRRLQRCHLPSMIRQRSFAPWQMRHSYSSEAEARADGLSSGYRYYFGIPVAVDVAEPQGALATGFFLSSAEDMAHYAIAFANHGRYQGVSVVNPDVLIRNDLHQNYNIYWIDKQEVDDLDNTESHSGGWLNYSSGLLYMPYAGIGVVCLPIPIRRSSGR